MIASGVSSWGISPQNRLVAGSASRAIISDISSRTVSIGVMNSAPMSSTPAQTTSPRSMSRSRMKGRGLRMPHAALIPFRMAPKAAVEAHSRATIDAIPVIARALTTPRTVSFTNSVETGTTSPIPCARAACCSFGPLT